MMARFALSLVVLLASPLAWPQAGPPTPKRTPKKTTHGWWSGYPPAAFDEARRTGKPIVVFFR